MEDKNSYISLEALAATLGLPQHYLKALANKKQIPYLNVNGRLRFDIEAVRHALNELAKKGVSDNDR